MVVSSSVELVDQFGEFVLEVSDQLLDGFDQLLKVALSLQVQFSVVQNELSPI